jgi:predicted NAD-dependent protein-ADP-ribosyltransferase YbiA (DUF1768 family)
LPGHLRTYLVETGEKILVKASPLDGIWGVPRTISEHLCRADRKNGG